jgi:hypothetical protein
MSLQSQNLTILNTQIYILIIFSVKVKIFLKFKIPLYSLYHKKSPLASGLILWNFQYIPGVLFIPVGN